MTIPQFDTAGTEPSFAPKPGDPGFQFWLNSLACSTEDCPNDPEPGEEQCYGCATGA